jgi:hypothetical protein
MSIRGAQILAVLAVAAVVCAVPAAAAAPPAPAAGLPLTANQLVYEGAKVTMQVDVNGEAAVQLVGGLLDAAAEVAHQQAGALQSMGPQAGRLAMLAPMIEPAKEIIKSVSRVTAYIMQPAGTVDGNRVVGHYSDMMTSRGWTPMVTVHAENQVNVAILVAPGAKGVFAAVAPQGGELVVAMVTTTRPIGEMLGDLVRAAGGPAAHMALMGMMQQHAPPPPAPPAQEPEE